MLSEVVWILSAASLLVAPGLLIFLFLPHGALPPRLILPAAFILSPCIIAVELAALALAGMPFPFFAHSVALVNLMAVTIIVLYRRPFFSVNVPIAWIVTASFIIAIFAMPVIGIQLRREYSWHNMMQLAAIQSIYSLPLPPEDVHLAGTILNYGWIGWAQVAVIAELTKIAPTLQYLPLNVISFLCLFVVLCESTRAVIPESRCTSATAVGISTGIALLTVGPLDLIFSAFVPSYQAHGESRITPMIDKYLNMDLMVAGISAAALMSFAMIRAAQSRNVGAARLMAISAFAASFTYPLFLPSCIFIGAAFMCFSFFARWAPEWKFALYSKAEVTETAAVWIVCVAVVVAYVAFARQHAVASPFFLWPWQTLIPRVGLLAWSFGLIDVFLIVIAVIAWRQRSAVLLLLISISFALQITFLLLAMPFGVEYKFLFVALIVSIPILSAKLAQWQGAGVERRIATAGVFALTLAICLLVLWRARTPDNLGLAVPLDESVPKVHPRREWSTSWLRAVRELTPDDAVLFAKASSQPIAVFAARALYVCADSPRTGTGARQILKRPGYSMTCLAELHAVKGYPVQEISRRLAILDSILNDHITSAEAIAVMKSISLLSRPIVLHTEGVSGFRIWLQQRRIGRAIFESDTEAVWLIDRDELPMARALSTDTP